MQGSSLREEGPRDAYKRGNERARTSRVRARDVYFTVRPRYSTSDGRADRSNLSAAIIPDNYVKDKNAERERERCESSMMMVGYVDGFSRLSSNRCKLWLKICKCAEFMLPRVFSFLHHSSFFVTETCEFLHRCKRYVSG